MAVMISNHPFFEALTAVAGADAVDRLCRERGGKEMRLTGSAFLGHWLTDFIGLERAQQVLDRLRSFDADGRPIEAKVYIPLGRHASRERLQQRGVELFSQGLNVRDVAAQLGVSERTASRIKLFPSITKSLHALKLKQTQTQRGPRIGLLELFLMEGRSDYLISCRLGLSFKEISQRRSSMKQSGMLDGELLARVREQLRKIGETIPDPSPDHSANVGEMVRPSDEAS